MFKVTVIGDGDRLNCYLKIAVSCLLLTSYNKLFKLNGRLYDSCVK